MPPWTRRRWRFHGWNAAWRRERSDPFIKTSQCGIQFAATRASRRLSKEYLLPTKRLATRDECKRLLRQVEVSQCSKSHAGDFARGTKRRPPDRLGIVQTFDFRGQSSVHF